MNKTAIKNFAVWAREKLIADIEYEAARRGVSEKGIAEPLPQSTKDLQFFDIGTKNYAEVSGVEIKQREALVNAIKAKEKSLDKYAESFHAVVEEVAYTWFNRLIAIRFMEVNDYLPSGIRVLSSENKAKKEPDFVTTPFATDMEFSPEEQDRIIQLKDENKLDELFRMLFIKQCNKLHEILPELFEKTDDYSELLLSISFTDEDGILYKLVHDIDEDDFNVEKEGQVEIIGWMYQYYNIEPKAKVFAKPKGQKIKKEEIPAATQLFTPDWIVRYMVENSLGRMWAEGRPSDTLKENWKYYLEEAEQEADVEQRLEAIRQEYKQYSPDQIRLIDPCMGSGHILVYAFDVFMQIYESYGYTQREAAKSILENNLYGIDIDKRAYQLSYFAVMMKARQYNRRILTQGIEPNLTVITGSGSLTDSELERLGEYKQVAVKLLHDFDYAEEYGSLLKVSCSSDELEGLTGRLNHLEETKDISNLIDILEVDNLIAQLKPLLKQARLLAQKYQITVTNPPYMPVSNGGGKLQDYVKENYPDSKTDLFAVFIERCKEMLEKNGLQAMITMHSWMFLTSYEKLREKLLNNQTIINMAHLGARAFEEIGGEVVQTTAFVLANQLERGYISSFKRLVDFNSQDAKEEAYLGNGDLYQTQTENFSKILGSPVAYWACNEVFNSFESGALSKTCETKQGFKTGDNERFLRLWYEVDKTRIGFQKEKSYYWYPCTKGGEYRKWYGNLSYIVEWYNDGYSIKHFFDGKGKLRSRPQNLQINFQKALTWSSISSGSISFRDCEDYMMYESKGPVLLPKCDYEQTLAYINTCVYQHFIQIIAPTLDYSEGAILRTPMLKKSDDGDCVIDNVGKNIHISKQDWDSFETSWDFAHHPLVGVNCTNHSSRIADCYTNWKDECEVRFMQLKANEEELNRIFIDIYGLQDELTPDVADKDVTVYRIFDEKSDIPESMGSSKYALTKQDVIKSFVSYAVGCMLGRYSLDVDGLAYAGGEWDKVNSGEAGRESGLGRDSKYKTFIPDADNCIPITDEEYFEEDIVGRFVEFVRVVYGSESLEENLTFIANALGNKGKSSREIIRNYFLSDFIKDHIKTYQKRPIYWLFDSGKQNGFKAVVYMHRWNADTTGNMRVEYLHRMQRVYEKEMERMQDTIDNSHDNKEISNATKRKEKLQKQYKETKEYDAKVGHLALSRIDIDLDDGVKVNYEKVQIAKDGTKQQILVKI